MANSLKSIAILNRFSQLQNAMKRPEVDLHQLLEEARAVRDAAGGAAKEAEACFYASQTPRPEVTEPMLEAKRAERHREHPIFERVLGNLVPVALNSSELAGERHRAKLDGQIWLHETGQLHVVENEANVFVREVKALLAAQGAPVPEVKISGKVQLDLSFELGHGLQTSEAVAEDLLATFRAKGLEIDRPVAGRHQVVADVRGLPSEIKETLPAPRRSDHA